MAPLSRQQFGVNLARERYYFLLVRKEYLTGELAAIASKTLTDLRNKFDHCEPWWGAQGFVFHRKRLPIDIWCAIFGGPLCLQANLLAAK